MSAVTKYDIFYSKTSRCMYYNCNTNTVYSPTQHFSATQQRNTLHQNTYYDFVWH